MASDNRHSRIVGWLKILLPLAALGILSTIFLVSRTISPEDAIPFAEVDVNEIAREERIAAPAYAGVTDDGTAITILADKAAPDTAGTARTLAEKIRAELRLPDGMAMSIRAATGILDTAERQISFDRGIDITTSSGVNIVAQSLTGSLDQTALTARGPISASGPMGRIEAGAMALRRTVRDAADTTPQEDDPANYVLVFKDGVKVVYDPPN